MINRRYILAAMLAAFFAIPDQAQAQKKSCSAWSFQLEQGEGGKQWSASICSSGDKGNSWLSLICMGSGINLRYVPAVEGDFSNQKRDFIFSAEAMSHRLLLAFEEMDGAFAGNPPRTGGVVDLIRKGRELTVTDPDAKVKPRRFSLRGAGKALERLTAKCLR